MTILGKNLFVGCIAKGENQIALTKEEFMDYISECWDKTVNRSDDAFLLYSGTPETPEAVYAIFGPGEDAQLNAEMICKALEHYHKDIISGRIQTRRHG